MLCLVNIAIMKYVVEGIMSDVSDSVSALFREDLLPRVDPDSLTPPNHFRTTQCYNEAVDSALRAHEASLALLFGALSETRGAAKNLLSFKAWTIFLRRIDLIGAVSDARPHSLTGLTFLTSLLLHYLLPHLAAEVPSALSTRTLMHRHASWCILVHPRARRICRSATRRSASSGHAWGLPILTRPDPKSALRTSRLKAFSKASAALRR